MANTFPQQFQDEATVIAAQLETLIRLKPNIEKYASSEARKKFERLEQQVCKDARHVLLKSKIVKAGSAMQLPRKQTSLPIATLPIKRTAILSI